MKLKERLKSNPFIKNKKMLILYFSVAAVATAISFLTNDWSRSNAPFVFAPGFSILFYMALITAQLVKRNSVIKNHKYTALLLLPVLFITSFMVFMIIQLDLKYPFLGFTIIPLSAMFVCLIYIVDSVKVKILIPYVPAVVFIFSFALFFYLIAAYMMNDLLASGIIILLVGVVLIIAYSVFYFLYEKKHKSTITDRDAYFKELFQSYLNAVFKNANYDEEKINLKEMLYGKLIAAYEMYKTKTFQDRKLYSICINSLGDYSGLIYDRNKSVFARISGFSYKVSEFIFCAILYCFLMFYGIIGANQQNWNEMTPVPLAGTAVAFLILLLMRVIKNFITKRHKFTAAIICFISLVMYLMISFFDSLETRQNILPSPYFELVIVFIVIAGVLSETAMRFFIKRKEEKKSNG